MQVLAQLANALRRLLRNLKNLAFRGELFGARRPLKGTPTFFPALFMKVDALHSDVQIPRVAPATPLTGANSVQVTQHNSAEEVGLLFGQQMELTGKAIDQRQLASASLASQVEKIGQLEQLYEQLGHPAQASLAHLTRQARIRLLQRTGLNGLLSLTGNDPARTHVVLKHASLQARLDGRDHEAKLAEDMLAKVHETFDGQVRAGLNTAQALLKGCDDTQMRQAVRQLYYASVVVHQSLGHMMQSLLGLFGGARFNNGLQLMRRALADDVAAQNPSLPTSRLRTLLLGLQACGQLNGVLCSCRELMQRLPTRLPQADEEAVTLLKRLLGYASSGIASPEVRRLGQEFGGENLSAQLVVLNALYPLLQRLPLGVWRDDRERQEALSNFLSLMDEQTESEGLLGSGRVPATS